MPILGDRSAECYARGSGDLRRLSRLISHTGGVRTALLAAVVLVITACTAATSDDGATQPPQTTTTSAATTTSGTRAVYERQCASRIGEGYGPADSEIAILHIGPVALLALDQEWLATNASDYFEPDAEGRYEGIKYVLVVAGDATGPASISIPESDRDSVRLVYDPDRFPPTWEEADHTVKFGVCEGIDAQFNGGFIVKAPICASVVVVDEGVAGSEWTASIPFGVPAESCPS